MMTARLAVLLVSPIQWLLVAWAVCYFLVLPVKNSLKGGLAAWYVAAVLGGTLFAQTKIYHLMTGIAVPGKDHYFFAVIIGQMLVSIGIMFFMAFKLRRKNR